MTPLDRLVRLWQTPSAFRDDWRAYGRNQALHALIVGFLPGLVLTLDTGAFTATGGNAGFLRALTVEAASGGFTVTGADANALLSLILAAETGVFVLTGGDAALVIPSGRFAFLGDGPNSLTLAASRNTLTISPSRNSVELSPAAANSAT